MKAIAPQKRIRTKPVQPIDPYATADARANAGDPVVTTTLRLEASLHRNIQDLVGKRRLRSMHQAIRQAVVEWADRAGKTSGVLVELDGDLYDQISLEANARGISPNDYIRTSCEESLAGAHQPDKNNQLVRTVLKCARHARGGNDKQAQFLIAAIELYGQTLASRDARRAIQAAG
jgi:Arc/MetJ-type ribon-helix-helix transcriptional regulator